MIDTHIDYRWIHLSDGREVPRGIHDGVEKAIHSERAPEREGLRNSSATRTLLITIGAGAGYQLPPPSKGNAIIHVVPDAKLYGESLNHNCPNSTQRSDVVPVVAHSNEDAAQLLSRVWDATVKLFTPILFDTVSISGQQYFVRTFDSFYKDFINRLQSLLEAQSADFATQRTFGKLWFNNILTNSSHPTSLSKPICISEFVSTLEKDAQSTVVIGAGPSLDSYPSLPNLCKNSLVIAIDTALPALASRGITADIAVCADPQLYSSYHFLPLPDVINHGSTPPKKSPGLLIADAGIHPAVIRIANQKGYVSILADNPHPMLQFPGLANCHVQLPFHGTNAGVMALAVAVEAARNSKKNDLICLGFDFASTGFQAYARDSWQYQWSASRGNRLNTAEHYHFSLASSGGTARYSSHDPKKAKNGTGYTSERYEGYRREFLKHIARYYNISSGEPGVYRMTRNDTIIERGKTAQDKHPVSLDPSSGLDDTNEQPAGVKTLTAALDSCQPKEIMENLPHGMLAAALHPLLLHFHSPGSDASKTIRHSLRYAKCRSIHIIGG